MISDAAANALMVLLCANAAAVFSGIAWVIIRIVKLETKVDRLMVDVDGVAGVVGTKRARARKEIRK